MVFAFCCLLIFPSHLANKHSLIRKLLMSVLAGPWWFLDKFLWQSFHHLLIMYNKSTWYALSSCSSFLKFITFVWLQWVHVSCTLLYMKSVCCVCSLSPDNVFFLNSEISIRNYNFREYERKLKARMEEALLRRRTQSRK